MLMTSLGVNDTDDNKHTHVRLEIDTGFRRCERANDSVQKLKTLVSALKILYIELIIPYVH